MKGRFANGVLRAFAPDVVSYKAFGMLVKSAQKICKKRKKTSFSQRNLMRLLKFAKMKETWTWEICFPTVEKIIDEDKTRLRHVIKVVEFCGRRESISKKHDGS